MIYVLGAGAFGTALAISLAQNGPVGLWARDPSAAQRIDTDRENKAKLAGVALPAEVSVIAAMPKPDPKDVILLAIPTQSLRSFLRRNQANLTSGHIVACCKGVEQSSGFGPTQIIADCVDGTLPAILTGPSFAHDIARGMPTALTLACSDDNVGKYLQQSLTTPNLRLYRTMDTVGAELGGALKNVVAIACGAAIGAGMGESARAALMTRGFAEMSRMASALGARSETLAGLSGFGDLTLTCTSEQSRNYRYGQSLGQASKFDASVTVEGVATSHAVLEKAAALNLDMPITAAVVALVDGKLRVEDAMDMLLSRPLKEE